MTYKFNAITIKIPTSYFVDIDKLIIKHMWEGKQKRPRIATRIPKNKVSRLTPPNLKTYSKAVVIKTGVVLVEEET